MPHDPDPPCDTFDVPIQPPDGTDGTTADALPIDAPNPDTSSSCLACVNAVFAFGSTPLGASPEVRVSCNTTCTVRIEDVSILPPNSALSIVNIEGEPRETQLPFEIPADGRLDLTVRFSPAVEGPIPTGTALVLSLAGGGSLSLPITGAGVEASTCARPVITVEGGFVFGLGDPVAISGRDSVPGSGGAIASWTWTVERPAGSNAIFVPSSYTAEVTLTPDVPGIYRVELQVRSENEVDGCGDSRARRSFSAGGVPLPLRVQLAWHTPEGISHTGPPPDPGIHVAHPNAVGYDLWGDEALEPWYDLRWDAYWGSFNYGKADWGVEGVLSDDPQLEAIPDMGPYGLENVSLDRPEAGLTYRVGVERYRPPNESPTPQPVQARVAIFFDESHAGITAYRALVTDDFWEVATVNPTTGVVTLIDELHPGVDTCPMPQCGD